jgi:Flp pilus assembly protein TadG
MIVMNSTMSKFHPRRGLALVYTAVIAVAMCAVGSLAMDYGRAECVKTELHRAAEAAAFSAMYEMQSGTGVSAAQTAAVNTAALNLADGTAVAIDSTNDIDFGTYDSASDTFTVLSGTSRSSANAIHVTARRTTARGTAVRLVLGPVIGINSVDVSADCVVSLNTPDKYGFVGLNSASFTGVDMDSYNSTNGAYGGSNHYGNSSIASNRNLTFAAGCKIRSEAHPGIGCAITKDGATHLGTDAPGNSGNYPILSPATAALTTVLYYPVLDAPATNNNANLGSNVDVSGNFSITADYNCPAGTYVVNNFTLNGHKLIGQGNIVFYIGGIATINKDCNAYLTDTHALLFYGTSTCTAINQTQSGGTLYCSIYAPTADVTIANDGFFGQAVGKTLTMTSNKAHYDESFADGTVGGPAKKKWIKKPSHWH